MIYLLDLEYGLKQLSDIVLSFFICVSIFGEGDCIDGELWLANNYVISYPKGRVAWSVLWGTDSRNCLLTIIQHKMKFVSLFFNRSIHMWIHFMRSQSWAM